MSPSQRAEAPQRTMSPWLRLASAATPSSIELHEEGLSLLEETGEMALVTFVSAGWPSRRDSLEVLRSKLLGTTADDSVPSSSESQPSLWVRREPLTKERTVLLAECCELLDGSAQLAALSLLASSTIVYATTRGDGQELVALERWGTVLEALMSSLVCFVDGEDNGDGHEGVFSAMPTLVWAMDGIEAGGSPGKALDAILAAESGFSDVVSRRNNVRLLLNSVFRRREATRLEPAVATRIVASTAQPNLAFGRVCSGAMVAAMLRVWTNSLRKGAKASVVAGYRAALSGLYERSLRVAIAERAAALESAIKLPAAPDALEHALATTAIEAERRFTEATRAVAPTPRGAGPVPQPPLADLRRTIRQDAARLVATNVDEAVKICRAHLEAAHSELLAIADKAANLSPDQSADVDDDDEEVAPTSRRAELWIQAYKSRLGALVADYSAAVECADACRGMVGEFLCHRVVDAASQRCRLALAALERERAELIAAMRKKRESIMQLEEEHKELAGQTHAAMTSHNSQLMQRMADIETSKMEKEAELASIDMEIESALRNAERVDARLRVKLEGAVSRASARMDDAKMIRQRVDDAALAVAKEAVNTREQLFDARLDALRVRCVTLGHEKANLAEHMELLEEHLERLKADLDQKHAEVAEVEHQWSQTKAKLPTLKAKHTDAEKRRAQLADLARKLKQACKQQGKGSLPRSLLQHLDPMERQALDDL